MASKAANVKATLKNPRTRMIYLGGIGVCVVIAVVALLVLSRKGNEVETSKVQDVPTVSSDYSKAQQATPEYDALLGKSNAEQAQTALKTGESSIPVPRLSADAPTLSDEAQEPATPQPATEATQPQAAAPSYTPEQLQQHEAEVQARMKSMRDQLGKITAYWSVQSHTTTMIASEKEDQAQAQASAVAAGLPQSGAIASNVTQLPSLKIGDMLYATLDTAINSDMPGPVLATVRQPGPFQGAKLIGQMQQNGQAKAVGIQFSAMAVPGEATSRSISAWAVDPNQDYRSALASDVNNHYFIRGLSTFVGSFMSGYADGLISGGQNQQVIQNDGYAVVQQDAYTTRQLNQIGLGNVGRKWAQEMDKSSDLKPTITVDAGIDVGILFTQDVTSAR
ncbi:DotG/IcmE/VirB10 family protein [Xanthomonas arboricola]|uniref:Intracellular multiplication protein IcmE n=1 Tax=Xanthomonas arboricola TaxID=56448 RepID=A0AB73H3F4_9XANT|nr:DotG/IcmE/VirB10 family protein [Xanthomonas arboricola]MBB5672597.1 intracellular multiplication protein IcmE [Xanthomonas arboricola]